MKRRSFLRAGTTPEVINYNLRRLVLEKHYSKKTALRIAFRKAGKRLPEEKSKQ